MRMYTPERPMCHAKFKCWLPLPTGPIGCGIGVAYRPCRMPDLHLVRGFQAHALKVPNEVATHKRSSRVHSVSKVRLTSKVNALPACCSSPCTQACTASSCNGRTQDPAVEHGCADATHQHTAHGTVRAEAPVPHLRFGNGCSLHPVWCHKGMDTRRPIVAAGIRTRPLSSRVRLSKKNRQ